MTSQSVGQPMSRVGRGRIIHDVGTLAAGIPIVVCWGACVLVWAAAGIYNRIRGPRQRTRDLRGTMTLLGVILVCAVLAVLTRGFWQRLVLVEAAWVRVLGLVILVPSTVLALWARLALGTMWTFSSIVKHDHQLRTDGPYAITRHPIYTGLLGMLLGTTLLGGIGQFIPLVPLGVILLSLKAQGEERLLMIAFPDDYPRYRRHVPQLVPGLGSLRRHRHQPVPP